MRMRILRRSVGWILVGFEGLNWMFFFYYKNKKLYFMHFVGLEIYKKPESKPYLDVDGNCKAFRVRLWVEKCLQN